ncbi:MAG: D-glycero-beta-D-manno-heptose-7-phosphate kinase [Candidatus Delongbacteria bacterium]|jgi:rfaE bifunctional protein kinase chain/domain|nr:D-glycero-beta-D-manno-heptose-7-phosphate kinase [Candidatus Delongbacteria bacterium]
MVKIDHDKYEEYLKKIKRSRIAVIGDLMLDVYFWGRTDRISPEAPVPVVSVTGEEMKPGGAANVSLNVKSLGAKPYSFGVIGNDMSGSFFIDNFKFHGLNTDNILIDKKRPTTVKTRILALNQHVVRFDKESTEDISKNTEKKLLESFIEAADNIDAVIFQDYNKGVLTSGLVKNIMSVASEKKILTAVDPKIKNFISYKGADIFKPNLKEAEEILKRKIRTDSEIEKAGIDLMDKLELKRLVITLSERGMAIFNSNAIMNIIPAQSAKIANVSGAGDTVISTLVAFICGGASFEEACTIANFAASIVVEDVSIIPVEPSQLKIRLEKSGIIQKRK